MIVFLRKGSIFLLSAAIFCITALLAIAFGSINIPVSETAALEKAIIIDAGHGDPDGGALGADGTKEAELNLAVARRLAQLFTASDTKVIMTRTTSEGIHDKELVGISAQKKSDMRRRREIRQSMGGELFISIHMNYFSDSKYYGAQVVCDNQSETSQQLAEYIQAALKEHVDPENNRAVLKSNGKLFLLKNASVPSVIVECGFMSNPSELALLKSEEYQDKLAQAIYIGVQNYRSACSSAQN